MTDQVSGSSLPQTRDLAHQHQQQQHNHIHFSNVDIEASYHNDNDNNDRRRHHHHHHQYHQQDHHHHNHHHHHHQYGHQHHNHHHHIRSQIQNKSPDRDNSVDSVDINSDDNSDDKSNVVVIVEAVSVLHVTHSTGSIAFRTLSGDNSSAITTSQSESTVVASTAENASFSDLPETTLSSNDGSGGGNGVVRSSSTSSIIEGSSATSTHSSMPALFPTISYAPITVAPSSRTPVFSPLSGLFNSTFLFSSASTSSGSLRPLIATGDGNLTILGAAAGTLHLGTSTHSLVSTRSASSTHPTLSTHPTSSTHSASSASSAESIHSTFGTSTSRLFPTATDLTNSANPNIPPANGGDGAGLPTNVPEGGGGSGSDHNSDTGNTSAATIAGSVVGAISGLAFILLLALAVLKWKKRRSNIKLIQGSGRERGYGAVTGSGGRGPTGAGGMSEAQRPGLLAIPAALAQGLFAKHTTASDGAERGFAKISGRKLPPVLQFGGDGYTDPRGSVMSDRSIDYRVSQHIAGEAALPRLALGSPILQEASPPVFHASPARTPVRTSGPFSDPFSDDHMVESPALSPALSPYSMGGPRSPAYVPTRSHASFSRFTEEL
ncbi:hypothetical protein GGS21DRAFT_547165 [Xylaria nigripes]|nr:hypothetical protein GGS21DRAFT_547165 [Xylaria nigripes]